jgi:glyoxylase I family protein
MSTTAELSASTTVVVPELGGVAHLGLTVSDIAASEAWYNRVLGLVRLFVEAHSTGDGYTVVMTRPGTALFLGLDHHPDANGEPFSPLRTGLDHVALGVPSRQSLDDWAGHLDAARVEHGAVFETTEPVPHALMVFRDPDGIPVELFWYGG